MDLGYLWICTVLLGVKMTNDLGSWMVKLTCSTCLRNVLMFLAQKVVPLNNIVGIQILNEPPYLPELFCEFLPLHIVQFSLQKRVGVSTDAPEVKPKGGRTIVGISKEAFAAAKSQHPTWSSKVRQPRDHISILGPKSERMIISGARRAVALKMSTVSCFPAH
jgi:hypothetical protein